MFYSSTKLVFEVSHYIYIQHSSDVCQYSEEYTDMLGGPQPMFYVEKQFGDC